MPLEKKVGQLFCVLGTIYEEKELYRLVHEVGVGGILFRPTPLKKLNSLYERIGEGEIPLLKAANLEEGGSSAYTEGTYFSSQMGVAATNDIKQCEHFAKICAYEGRKAGVNWTFSPVSDIDYNFRNPITNVRTFGSDPEKVKAFTEEYVRTVQANGIACAAKHFPGDGVDFRDQHLHPTINSLSVDEWESSYGNVYRNLINNGLLSIMVGHIKQPALEMAIDPSLTYGECKPASLSKPLLTGLLRERYGFNGLLVNDATIMAGFTIPMKRGEALPYAISSGIDMLVFSTDIDEDLKFMLEGVKGGLLSQSRLDAAVARILALKARLARPYSQSVLPNNDWAKECGDEAITLVKDIKGIIPLSPTKTPSIRLIVLGKDEIEGESIGKTAKDLLNKRGFTVEIYNREKDEMHGVNNLSCERLTLYLVNEPTESNRTTVRLSWNPKHALDVPRHPNEEPYVFVSLNNPYHLQDVPNIGTYINAYSPTLVVLEKTIEKLVGESPFKGISPVDPFCGLPDTHY